jgi:hypothetical protein
MKIPSQKNVMQQIADRLAELINLDLHEMSWERTGDRSPSSTVIHTGPFTFVVQWKGAGAPSQVAVAIEQVRLHTRDLDGTIVPVVAVPFMGEAGRERCAEADVAWLDLSGNARIVAPGLRIMVEGKPNLYKRPGRPSTVFAPKSSRIARWLLIHPTESLTQREIARATDTDEGYTSRIVGKLEEYGLILRDDSGAIRPKDPNLLLDAWREEYDFKKHHILRGHVAARSGDALLRKLAEALNRESIPHAATGLAAAWIIDRFAGFRTATLYLPEEPSSELLTALSFREDDRGANVWLVTPNDEGVFHGAGINDGVRCVHPVQVYLDLHAHPERAAEAAKKLRSLLLNWKFNA